LEKRIKIENAPILFASLGSKSLHKMGTMDSAKSGAPFGFARLFKVFPPTHFFFKTASFDQFAKPTNRFLDRLFLSNN
jgi:hypothetical protein